MGWVRFEDKLPTEEEMGQKDIFFCHPKWATFIVGLYTNYPDSQLREKLAQYNQQDDKYYEWVSMLPTHWMYAPKKPTNTKFQVEEAVDYLGKRYIVVKIEERKNGLPDYLIEDRWNTTELVEENFLEKIR